jgi:hypothetical protein
MYLAHWYTLESSHFTVAKEEPQRENGICFHAKSLYNPAKEGKAIFTPCLYILGRKPLQRYAGQNEVGFKVTNKQKEFYRKIAPYLYENNLIESQILIS